MSGSMQKRGALLSTAAAIALAAGAAAAQEGPYFERVATFPVYLNLPEGTDPATETVAEIVAATDDGMMVVYTDSPGERIGMVDISDPAAPAPAGGIDLDGEPTSVAVVGGTVLAGVNTSESYTEPSGHVAVIALDSGEVSATCDVGGQPDSVAKSPDGAFLAVAVENERDEDLNDGVIPQLPPGHLAIFDLEDGVPTNCEAARIVDLTGLAQVAPEDPEPEFVDINDDNIAVVTLQENNHLVLVDMASGEVTGNFSAGVVDLARIDTVEDGIIQGTGTLEGVRREPDAVAWIDTERFVTANEGDYEGGSRGITIFATDSEILYESGESFDHLAMSRGHYPESRSENKGSEPEGVEVGTFDDTTFIFANSERGNFVAVAEVAQISGAYFQMLPTAVAPEGSVAIPERDLFVVATEEDSEDDGIRGTISIYSRTAEAARYATLFSAVDPATNAPIGWGALSGLAAHPNDPNFIYAVSDSYYSVSRIYTIDVSAIPATITGYVDLVRDGEPQAYDLEGIAPRVEGGFWLASEGNPENENPNTQRSLLLQVAEDGTVVEEIALPDEAYATATNRGFEGVAAWGEGDAERVIIAQQMGWEDDPETMTKLPIYDPAAGTWSFVHYPLAEPESERGGWVGLSEITHLGDERFAILERDNQPGDYAAIKTITVVDLAGVEPVAFGEEPPVLEKELAVDLLPILKASNGWISDKPEGVAVTADGRVFVVTDNDGVDDASGETLFLPLGTADELF